MIQLPVLAAHQRAARRRVALDMAAIALPLVLAASVVAWRLSGLGPAVVAGALGIAAAVLIGARRARPFDQRWLVGELDARVPSFEDSSALLLPDRPAAGALALLQRKRLEARIAEASALDLRPPWSRRAIAGAWAAGALAVLAALLWPEAARLARPLGPDPVAASPPGAPRITGARLRITPPAYTGLPAREQSALDARAPEGSRIEWTVDFEPRPASASLTFPEDGSVSLGRDGRRWRAARVMDRSMLYRIEAPSLPRQRLHRLDAVADAEPVVRVVEPQSQLVMVRPGQARWSVVFEAADDYGVAASALLRITVTKGDGENITFHERSTVLGGRGEARRKRYAVTLDLRREGMAAGSDLIVQLVASDNRAPRPHQVEGPSVILRWPAEVALADGMDGMLRSLPTYFRSQRQIIIDAEALLKQQRRLSPDAYLDRSNSLGIDQAALRLRYGQFMGEESEGGGGGIALPTNDAKPAGPSLPTDDAPAAPAPAAPAEEHHADDGHDHGAEAPQEGVGSAPDVLAEYGHAHDTGDAATLFDRGTQSTLSLALDAMWGSERALRQGRPDEALPFARKALEYLKEAQQASRIFLARVGPNLPPIDFSRRLTGKREGIAAAPLPDFVPPPADTAAQEAWRALEERPGRTPPLRLDTLDRWVRDNRGRLADPLGLTAAIDTVRAEPGCLACRRTLRAQLWAALQPPAASVRRREAPRTRGQRYLDALR